MVRYVVATYITQVGRLRRLTFDRGPIPRLPHLYRTCFLITILSSTDIPCWVIHAVVSIPFTTLQTDGHYDYDSLFPLPFGDLVDLFVVLPFVVQVGLVAIVVVWTHFVAARYPHNMQEHTVSSCSPTYCSWCNIMLCVVVTYHPLLFVNIAVCPHTLLGFTCRWYSDHFEPSEPGGGLPDLLLNGIVHYIYCRPRSKPSPPCGYYLAPAPTDYRFWCLVYSSSPPFAAIRHPSAFPVHCAVAATLLPSVANYWTVPSVWVAGAVVALVITLLLCVLPFALPHPRLLRLGYGLGRHVVGIYTPLWAYAMTCHSPPVCPVPGAVWREGGREEGERRRRQVGGREEGGRRA